MAIHQKKIFCTFADSRLSRTLKRIKNQAHAIGIYDELHVLTETDLDFDFINRFKDHLIKGSKGYGYWVWKPQIILQTLEKMNDGDLLQYTDAGCWINQKGKNRLLEYFELANEYGALAFQVKNTFDEPHLNNFSLPSRNWTKGDIFDYFNVRNNPEITDTEQIGAGIIFLKKSNDIVQLIKDWLRVYEDNFSLVDDTPSFSKNLDGFIENRHDQSIFGILCKLRGINTLSAFEYYYPSAEDPTKADWSKLHNYPIWAKRDKNLGIWGALLYKFNRILARFTFNQNKLY